MKETFMRLTGICGVALSCFATTVSAEDCWMPNDCATDCCDWSFCNGKFSIGADWLYWKVEEDNLTTAALVDDFPGELKTVFVHNIKNDFEYDSGFRVSLGYDDPCNIFELSLDYTYIPIHSKKASGFASGLSNPDHGQLIVVNNESAPLLAAFSQNPGQVGFSSIFLDWRGNISYLDLDVATTVPFFCDRFKIRPHIGFRAAWIDQKFRTSGELIIPSSINDTEFASAEQKVKMDGYGVEGGLWAEWKVGCGLSLVGHFGGSILYSNFRTHGETNGFNDDDVLVFIVHVNDHLHSAISTADYFVGLQYEDCFWDKQIAAHIGWEQHMFFDLNRFTSFEGDLSAQGLTLGLDVNF